MEQNYPLDRTGAVLPDSWRDWPCPPSASTVPMVSRRRLCTVGSPGGLDRSDRAPNQCGGMVWHGAGEKESVAFALPVHHHHGHVKSAGPPVGSPLLPSRQSRLELDSRAPVLSGACLNRLGVLARRKEGEGVTSRYVTGNRTDRNRKSQPFP